MFLSGHYSPLLHLVNVDFEGGMHAAHIADKNHAVELGRIGLDEKALTDFTLEMEKRFGHFEVERVRHTTESQASHVSHDRRLNFLETAYEKINTKMDAQKQLLNTVAAMTKAAAQKESEKSS